MDIDGLILERSNSSVLAMELHLSCTNSSIWKYFVINITSVLIVQIASCRITKSIIFNNCYWYILCKSQLFQRLISVVYFELFLFHPLSHCWWNKLLVFVSLIACCLLIITIVLTLLGADSIKRHFLTSIMIAVIKMRGLWNSLIFITGVPIPVRWWHLYIESAL